MIERTPTAMVARAYVDGSGTIVGWKARASGKLLVPVLHEVRKLPAASNLLMVALL